MHAVIAGASCMALAGLGAAQAQDCAPNQTPAITMSQTGFGPDDPKRAILRTDYPNPVEWVLRGADSAAIARGSSTVHGADESAGHAVHILDFSAVKTPGEDFVLEACGAGTEPFPIARGRYGQLADDALNYFYLNRLGTPIEAAYAPGAEWSREAGFPEAELTCFRGSDIWGTQWPGCDYRLDVTGGWADAGDYGQYAVNGGVSVWTLQHFAEWLQATDRAGQWPDGRATMPEAGNGVPDMLDEARWHLEWLLAMQAPDGARLFVAKGEQGVEDPLQLIEIDAGGLVHHKVHERHWLPLPILPGESEAERFLMPPSTAGALNMAAAAAQCARLWRAHDSAFAARCLQAAERAYAAALRHPDIFAHGNFDGGGAYGDMRLEDEFAWAAAELYASTGEGRYLDALQASGIFDATESISWLSVDLLPALTVVTAGGFPDDLHAAARAQITAAADRYLDDRNAQGYAVPFGGSGFAWGSNGDLANRAMVLAAAHDLTGERVYRDAMVDAMDYMLGRNALDQSYVAGYGRRAMRHPHHRFWAQGADPAWPPAPPGALSGGPNSQDMADPVAREMRGRRAPQQCWADDHRAYALNEVAINWNAPLFWAAAYLDATEARE